MFGPQILARSMSVAVSTGASRELWQYHPRGDRHSKIACWGVLFDAMRHSAVLRRHIEAGEVAFGINHEMRDFRVNKKKNLDLVLCKPAASAKAKNEDFGSLVARYGIHLSSAESEELARLPQLRQGRVGAVSIALEAKACMTAHTKAKPRLFDELNSSHQTIHGSSSTAIAAGFVMVNFASEFVSPGRSGYCPHCQHRVAPVTQHRQPKDAADVISKIRELPRRSNTAMEGFDAVTIVGVDCRNDGSPVELVTEAPAPQPGDIFSYESFVHRIVDLYESRFPRT